MGIIEAVKYVTREEALEEGRKEAFEQVTSQFIRNMFQQTDFNAAEIAFLAGVDETFVLEIKEDLGKV